MTNATLSSDFHATSLRQPVARLNFSVETADIAKNLSGKGGRANLNVLAQALDVKINLTGVKFSVEGPKSNADTALNLLKVLAPTVEPDFVLTTEAVQEMLANPANENADKNKDFITLPPGQQLNTRIEPRNDRQRQQILGFRNSDIVFATGEAGTGKTWLSVMLAIEALESGKYPGGLILVRPAVEAGEKLGYMPGDLQSKVDGYMRPLYDALEEVYGENLVASKMRDKIIEIAAVAFMRGRDIKNSLIILDESQNMTEKQMKLLLTRVGEGSKIMIAGDVTQIDLEPGVTSGLADIIARLKHPDAEKMGLRDNTTLVEYLPGDSVRSAAATRALGLYSLDVKPQLWARKMLSSLMNAVTGKPKEESKPQQVAAEAKPKGPSPL